MKKSFLVAALAGVSVGILIILTSRLYNARQEAIMRKREIKIHNAQKNKRTDKPHLPTNIKLPIITYHYVENVADPGDKTRIKLNINPLIFENQLREMHEASYSSYFVSDVPRILKGKEKISDHSIILTFDDGYEDFYINAYPLLKKYRMRGTIYIIANFIGHQGFMSEREIREMIGSGLIEVGDHTLSHLDLTNIKPDVARHQIVDSKKALEDMFGIKVTTFAYPGGFYNPAVEEMVKEASFEAAVSTKPGVYLNHDRLFTLPRVRAGYLYWQSIKLFFDKFKS